MSDAALDPISMRTLVRMVKEMDVFGRLANTASPEALMHTLPLFLKHLKLNWRLHSQSGLPTEGYGASSLIGVVRWSIEYPEAISTTLKDYWPDIWSWISYLLTIEAPENKFMAHTACCLAITCLTQDAEMYNIIASTPGIISTLTRAWINETNYPLPVTSAAKPYAKSASGALRQFTYQPKPEWVDEILHLAGGDLELARYALDSIRIRIRDPLVVDLTALSSDLRIVLDIYYWQSEPLRKELYTRSCSETIKRAMHRLLCYQGVDRLLAADALGLCISYFVVGLKVEPGIRWAKEMLCSSFFHAITQGDKWSPPALGRIDYLADSLRTITPYLNHRSVLLHAESAIERINDLGIIDGIGTAQKLMVRYCTVIEERLKVLENRMPHGQICNNQNYLKVDRRHRFLRCGRCQMAFYCNAECQRRSWKFGGHKNICKAAEISEPTGFVDANQSQEDIKSIKTLVHYDLSVHRELLRREADLLMSDPGDPNPIIAIFDYTVDPPTFRMERHEAELTPAPKWSHPPGGYVGALIGRRLSAEPQEKILVRVFLPNGKAKFMCETMVLKFIS